MLKNNRFYSIIMVTLLSSTSLHAVESNPAFELGIMLGKSIGKGVSSLFIDSKEEEKTEPVSEEKKKESSGGVSGFFGSLFKAPTPEEILAKASDKEMTKAFLEAKVVNPKINFSQSSNGIEFNNIIVPFDAAHTFGEARALCAKIDTTNDPIAEIYKKVVTNRGNYYSVYSGTVNASIQNAIFGQLSSTNGNDEYYKYDFDNAIVEHAPDGSIISALTRMDQISLNMMIRPNNINYYNIEIRQLSRIFSKEQLSVVSRIVSKRIFDDNLVLTSKQESKAVSVAAPAEDKATKIKALFDLYKSGALTKEEFEKEKKQLLGV